MKRFALPFEAAMPVEFLGIESRSQNKLINIFFQGFCFQFLQQLFPDSHPIEIRMNIHRTDLAALKIQNAKPYNFTALLGHEHHSFTDRIFINKVSRKEQPNDVGRR